MNVGPGRRLDRVAAVRCPCQIATSRDLWPGRPPHALMSAESLQIRTTVTPSNNAVVVRSDRGGGTGRRRATRLSDARRGRPGRVRLTVEPVARRRGDGVAYRLAWFPSWVVRQHRSNLQVVARAGDAGDRAGGCSVASGVDRGDPRFRTAIRLGPIAGCRIRTRLHRRRHDTWDASRRLRSWAFRPLS